MHKIAFFTMDVEDFTDIECLKNYSFKQKYDVSDGIINYLNILEKYNIKANLFLVNSYIKDIKEILVKAISKNHKIALHGYNHTPSRLLKNNEFERNIQKAKKEIKELFNVDTIGYRAPCFSLNNEQINILKNNGIIYDSSYLNYKNTYYKGNFSTNHFKKIKDGIYFDEKLYEFILPVYHDFPLGGGGYLRIAPWFFIKYRLKKYLKKHDTYVFYLHPFELSNTILPNIKGLRFYDKMYLKYNRKIYSYRIEKIIHLLIKYGFEFKTFEEIIEDEKILNR